MSVYKRPGSDSYYCRFQVNGKEIRRSTQTTNKRKAEAFERQLRERIWSALNSTDRTFEDLAVRWIEEHEWKRSLHTDQSIISWFLPHLTGKLLSQIDGDTIADLRSLKLSEAKAQTVNRHMAWLRSALNLAKDQWGWIQTVPKIGMYRVAAPEPRWLTRNEMNNLLDHLPEYLADVARFAVLTGLRSGAIRTLEWKHCQPGLVLISVEHSKNKKPLRVVLCDDAREVLEAQRGKHPQLVFTRQGHPLRRELTNKSWQKAVKKAGLAPLRFHDLRHTWATWHIQAGTPIDTLQRLGGWSSLTMVQRYAHHAPDDLDQWARRMHL